MKLRTLTAWLGRISLALALSSCADGVDDETRMRHEAVNDGSTMQCEPGYIPWKFPEGTNEDLYSEEYRARAGGDLEIEPASLRSIDVRSVSCPGWDDARNEVALRVLRASCGNNRYCMDFTDCESGLTASYTCGAYDKDASGDLSVRHATAVEVLKANRDGVEEARQAIELKCPQPPPRQAPESRAGTECIPAECHGRARRNLDMQCELAPEKEEVVVAIDEMELVPVDAPGSSGSRSGAGSERSLFPLGVYDVKVKVTFGHDLAPEEAKFAAWMEDEFEEVDANGEPMGTGTVRVFRCSPFSFEFRKDAPGVRPVEFNNGNEEQGDWVFEQSLRVSFAEHCFTEATIKRMLDDAAKQFGTDIDSVRPVSQESFPSSLHGRTRLHLAYDLAGKTVWHKDMDPHDSFDSVNSLDFYASVPACAPNPIDFYYQETPRGPRYDMVGYYSQRHIASLPEVLSFSPTVRKRAEVGPLSVELETPSAFLKVTEPNEWATVRATIHWYIRDMLQDLSQGPDAKWKQEKYSHPLLPTYPDDVDWAGVRPQYGGEYRPWAPEGLKARIYLVPSNLSQDYDDLVAEHGLETWWGPFQPQRKDIIQTAGNVELRWDQGIGEYRRKHLTNPELIDIPRMEREFPLLTDFGDWIASPSEPQSDSLEISFGGGSTIEDILKYADPREARPFLDFDVVYCIESKSFSSEKTQGFAPLSDEPTYAFYSLNDAARSRLKETLHDTCMATVPGSDSLCPHVGWGCRSGTPGPQCDLLNLDYDLVPHDGFGSVYKMTSCSIVDGKESEVCDLIAEKCSDFTGTNSRISFPCDQIGGKTALEELATSCTQGETCAEESIWQFALEGEAWEEATRPEEPWRVRGCRVAPLPLTVEVDRFLPSVSPLHNGPYGGFASRNATNGGDFSMAMTSQNTVTCQDGAATNCVNSTGASSKSEGFLEQTVFAVTMDAERDLARTDATVSGKALAEVLSYQVFDSGPLLEEKNLSLNYSGDVVGVEAGESKFTLTLTPPWGPVVDRLNGPRAATLRWIEADYAGVGGIGLGVSLEKQINLVHVVTTVAAGVSVGAEFSFEFAPPNTSSCVNADAPCYVLHDKANYEEARQACRGTGGRLAELSSSAEAAKVVEAAGDEVVWLGASLYYYQGDRQCAASRSEASRCVEGSSTSYRWQSTAEPFAEHRGTAVATYTDGMFWEAQPTGLSTQYPHPGAVTFDAGIRSFGTGKLTDERAFICRLEPLEKELYMGLGAALKLGAGVGFQATGCTPSSKAGLCLQVDVNFISVGMSPGFSFARRWLMRDANFDSFRMITETGFDIPWSLKALEVKIQALARFLAFSVNKIIFEFDGIEIDSGSLFKAEGTFVTESNFE